MREWWLILKNDMVFGAGENEEATKMKIDNYVSRLPVTFIRKGEHVWESDDDIIRMVKVREVEDAR